MLPLWDRSVYIFAVFFLYSIYALGFPERRLYNLLFFLDLLSFPPISVDYAFPAWRLPPRRFPVRLGATVSLGLIHVFTLSILLAPSALLPWQTTLKFRRVECTYQEHFCLVRKTGKNTRVIFEEFCKTKGERLCAFLQTVTKNYAPIRSVSTCTGTGKERRVRPISVHWLKINIE